MPGFVWTWSDFSTGISGFPNVNDKYRKFADLLEVGL